MVSSGLPATADFPDLVPFFHEALVRARTTPGVALASITGPLERQAVSDPARLFGAAAATGAARFFWADPDDGTTLVGVGAAQCLMATGPGRHEILRQAWREAVRPLVAGPARGSTASSGAAGGPVWLGGFSFDPLGAAGPQWSAFPDALLILPRFLFTFRGGQAWLTVNALLRTGDDAREVAARYEAEYRELRARVRGGMPPPCPALPAGGGPRGAREARRLCLRELEAGRWREAVHRAAAAAGSGTLEKVVLARCVELMSARPFAPGRLLAALRRENPGCTVFAVGRQGWTFAGASPELLARLRGRHLATASLAGSAPRGSTPEEDRLLGRALLESPKERHEHAVVVRALRESLEPLCRRLEVPAEPRLLPLRTVQHLHTPIAGELVGTAGEHSVLDLVAALHPTPAVGGSPRDPALALIRAAEPHGRGWYAGPIGWVDASGDGCFVVGIRSALVADDGRAWLYAGSGVVAGSDPESEYRETRLKLAPVLSALREAAG